MAKSRAGGGPNSNKVVHRPHGKTEPRANAYRPQGVTQYGAMQGSHVTHDKESPYRGEPKRAGRGYEPVGPTSLMRNGPHGEGRIVMKSGSQQQYGSGGAPEPSGRDILSSYGPESK
jgi:hypothetical protein